MSTSSDHGQRVDPPIVCDGAFGDPFAGHHDDGYAAGYRRAVNELLSDLILMAEECARDLPGCDEAAAGTRQALRGFARQFERYAERKVAGPAAGGDPYLTGGLGI